MRVDTDRLRGRLPKRCRDCQRRHRNRTQARYRAAQRVAAGAAELRQEMSGSAGVDAGVLSVDQRTAWAKLLGSLSQALTAPTHPGEANDDALVSRVASDAMALLALQLRDAPSPPVSDRRRGSGSAADSTGPSL